jgi:hypothetical protein
MLPYNASKTVFLDVGIERWPYAFRWLKFQAHEASVVTV